MNVGAADSGDLTRPALLLREHERTGEAITSHYLAIARLAGLSLVAFGAGAALGPGDVVRILVPIGLALVALYLLDVLRQLMLLTGYRRYLEDEINAVAGERVLLWTSWIAPLLVHRSPSRHLLLALYGLSVLTASGVSVVASVTYEGAGAAWVQAGGLVFWMATWVAGLAATVENIGAAERARTWAEAARSAPADASAVELFRRRRRRGQAGA